MIKENHTALSDFIFVGYSELPILQVLLFVVFLLIYMTIITGNVLIIYIIVTNPSLDTPMYFFLKSLAFLEIFYTSVTLPKILVSFVAQNKTISFVGWTAQIYFVLFLRGTECFLLATMAYDRYVAICNPLHYKLIMCKELCLGLVTGALIINMPVYIGQIYLLFTLLYCSTCEINNFFCDIPPVLELACADTFASEVYMAAASALILVLPFCPIFASYVKIIFVILKMPSVEGWKKLFATCSSHLIVVSLFYGSATIVYVSSRSKETLIVNKLLSLFYTILIPMLNPIIYNLRNTEVKVSLRKLFGTCQPDCTS
ncbi:olfactory receptor 10A7-like [Heteronotia binoei]|uniref:olfactory receptor 10A7-like n=1 Tax=Heteronotia binoei TaxID=13085 RepID=UPI00292FAB5C|nr:olfactory receptor 10A7-like [Heteronotia binoei]